MGRISSIGLITVWASTLVGAMSMLLAYANGPSLAADPPLRLAAHAALGVQQDRATLLVFVHPRCPCTRASLRELARLTARWPGDLQTVVLFYRPAGSSVSWARTDLWTTVARIPGAESLDDPGGLIARRFGVRTSGQMLLYDTRGQLRFDGGITVSRGHEGDSPGKSSILAILSRAAPAGSVVSAPVFGCALFPATPAEVARAQ